MSRSKLPPAWECNSWTGCTVRVGGLGVVNELRAGVKVNELRQTAT